MTILKKKNTFAFGIVLAIVAIAISMMFNLFSYASENEADATTTNDTTYTLKIQGFKDTDEGEHFLNCDLYYYDMDDNFIAKATTGSTDDDPWAVFAGLTYEQTNGKVVFYTSEGYSLGADYIYTNYFDEEGGTLALRKFVCTKSNVDLSGDSNLDYFNYHAKFIDSRGLHDLQFIVQSFRGSLDLYAAYYPTCVAEVFEGGIVKITCTAPDETPLAQFTFTPAYKEGYTFDFVQIGDEQYKVGDKLTFSATDKVSGVVHCKSDSPFEPKSVLLYGQVTVDNENGSPIAGATVKFGNEETGEVYSMTTTAEDGTYEFTDISVDLVEQIIHGKIAEPCVYTIYPGYEFDMLHTYYNDWKASEDKYVCKKDLNPSKADVNIQGSDHHKTFIAKIERSSSDATKTMIYNLETIGLAYGGLIPSSGLSFDIAEGGSLNGGISLDSSNSNAVIQFTINPEAAEGYVFDYIQVNDDVYRVGDTVTFDGDNLYNTTVFYKPVDATGIAQTGDVIPFAILVGIGLVVIAAFAIARKQYNR